MKCDFIYCIYNKKSSCILDKIQLDSIGMCEQCEIVTIPKKILNNYKKNRLKTIYPTTQNS